MNNNSKYYKEVLLDGLKMTIANTSLLIEKGCKDNTRLLYYTNYYAAIVLKSFDEYIIESKEYTKKEFALKKFSLIHAECFNNALGHPESVEKSFEFKKEYNLLDQDTKLVIMAILLLSSFYKNNGINKVKNILHTYIPKLNRTLKNAKKYYPLFKDNYSDFQKQTSLFNFLIENS